MSRGPVPSPDRRWWTRRLASAGIVLGLVVGVLVPLRADLASQEIFASTVRASVTSSEGQATGYAPSISADGKRVAFLASSNQLPGYNGSPQVYVRDLQAGTTTLVSATSAGASGNSLSANPVISADGTKVAFESMATNFDMSDTNGTRDIYLADIDTPGMPVRVSVGVGGQVPNAPVNSPSLDADGSLVAWVTEADNLDPVNDPPANENTNIFVRDVAAGTTRMVSIHNMDIGLTHDPANGNQFYGIVMSRQAISDDGRWLVFKAERYGGPFQSAPCSGTYAVRELFVADLANPGPVSLLVERNEGCNGIPVIAGDGSTVVFLNRASDGFRWLPPTGGAHSPIDLTVSGSPDSTVSHPRVSGDGTIIAFDSAATNLVAGDTNNATDVFAVSRDGAQIGRVSLDSDAGQADQPDPGNRNSSGAAISRSGYHVAFTSNASDLVGGDTNGTQDVFVRSATPEYFDSAVVAAQHGRRENAWYAGDPVHTATGNLLDTQVDLTFASNTWGLDWSRTYNSRDSHTGPLGRGWTGSFDASVFELANGDVTFTGTDGRVVTFVKVAADVWTTPEEIYGGLARNIDGSLRLDYIDGETWSFDVSGRLATKTNWDGRTVTVARNPDGTPATVTASTGAVLTFAWDAATGRLASVTAGDGRAIAYTYTADDRHALATITDPTGAVWTFDADELGRIVEVRDPEGRLVIGSTYDHAGRVTVQTNPDGGTVTFSYGEDGLTVVRDGATGDVTRYAHDRLGRILQVTDANGNSLDRGYDPATGTRTDATDRAGTHVDQRFTADRQLEARTAVGVNSDGSDRHTAYAYDALHRLTTMTETGPSGSVVTTYAYTGDNRIPDTVTGPARPGDLNPPVTTIDSTGGLVGSVTDADGVETAYTWNTVTRQLDAVTTAPGTPAEATTTFGYTPEGWLATVTSPLGHQTRFTYDDAGRVTVRRDPTGAEWTTTYDDAGNRLTETDPTGATTSWTYNDAGRAASVTDPRGNTTRYTYDDAGDLVAVAEPDGDASAANDPTTTYAYGPLARLESMTDPTGVTTSYEYDDNGRLTATRNEDGAAWTTTYWPDGQVRSESHPETTAAGEATERFYDVLGRLSRVVDPDGTETTYSYDASGNLIGTAGPRPGQVETRTYTVAGRLETVTDGEGNTIRYGYDAAGRPVTTTLGDGTALAATATVAYDLDGRTASSTSPEGRVATYTYDAAGRVLTEVHPDSGVVTNTWTARGELATARDPEGGLVQRFYDPAGNLARVIDANDNPTEYGYDARNNRVQRTNALGGIETWSYDAADRRRTHVDPNGVTTHVWAYDQLGRLATVTDASGRTQTVGYDAADRITSSTWTHDGDSLVYTTSYDSNGRVAVRSGPDGSTTYGYDPAGNLTSVNAPGVFRDFTAVWDDAGRRTALTGADGSTTATWDALGRVATVTHASIGTTTYGWNRDGQVTAEDLPGSSGRVWAYDPVTGELTTYTEVLPAGTTSTGLDHDRNGRLIGATTGADGRAYEYDAAGQLLEASLNGAVTEAYTYDPLGRRATSVDASGTHEYRYDPASRLLTRIAPDAVYPYSVNVDINGTVVGALVGHQPGDTSYTYDESGRRIAADAAGAGTTTYDWDPAGRLTTITDPADAASERSYHAAGQLGGWSVGTDTTPVSWDPTTLEVAAIGETGVVNGLDHLAADGGLLGRDHLGSTTSGAASTAQGYDSYGNPTTAPTGATLGYRGELHLDGLVHLRHRDYDPTAGAFITVDPLDGVDGMATVANPYSYANNDPLNQIDPLGLRPTDDDFMDLPSEEEVQAEVDRLTRRPGLLEGNSIGACGTLQMQGFLVPPLVIPLAVEGEICGVYDGDEVTVLAFAAGGSGTPYGAASAGPLLSNAETHHQLLGWTACVGGGAGFVGSAGVELCLGLTSSGDFSGVWSLWGGGGLGAGVDVHVVFGRTEEIFSVNVPCVGGWDLPDLPATPWFDLPDLSTLPSAGCG